MELKDYIVKTRFSNRDGYIRCLSDYSNLDTTDYLFLEGYDDIKNLGMGDRRAYPSDYAVMNGALCMNDGSAWQWLRTYGYRYHDYIDSIGTNTTHGEAGVCETSAVICPKTMLDLSAVIDAQKKHNIFEITPTVDEKGEILYHTIKFAAFPQCRAKNSAELEMLYNIGKIHPTGKKYYGYINDKSIVHQNPEFEFGGKKYVRVIANTNSYTTNYKDHTPAPIAGTPVWAEVQPISWKIRNWEELPQSINPNGSSDAKTIDVRSEDGLLSGTPFNTKDDYNTYHDGKEYRMWQNSIIRAILNGYNIHEELMKGNGSMEFAGPYSYNYNFKGHGFLQEAFDDSKVSHTTMSHEDDELTI